jgi:hypothetical protein
MAMGIGMLHGTAEFALRLRQADFSVAGISSVGSFV